METFVYVGMWVTTLFFTFFIIYNAYKGYKELVKCFECKSLKSKILYGIISLVVVLICLALILSVICFISKELFLAIILFMFGGYLNLIEQIIL
jgi:hypothetical protein